MTKIMEGMTQKLRITIIDGVRELKKKNVVEAYFIIIKNVML